MNRSFSHYRLAAVIIATSLAVAATGMLLRTKHSPAADASARSNEQPSLAATAAGVTKAPAPKVLTKADAAAALPSVSVRGEVITAHLATVPESVWHERTPAQPPYAAPAPAYEPFPRTPLVPGVPIISSPLRPADPALPTHSEK